MRIPDAEVIQNLRNEIGELHNVMRAHLAVIGEVRRMLDRGADMKPKIMSEALEGVMQEIETHIIP